MLAGLVCTQSALCTLHSLLSNHRQYSETPFIPLLCLAEIAPSPVSLMSKRSSCSLTPVCPMPLIQQYQHMSQCSDGLDPHNAARFVHFVFVFCVS
eukprot:m.574488 g.574488  ORF g.574488 m.574488 type:complete len:96 (-) comp57883_c0_seq78:67-354(-)